MSSGLSLTVVAMLCLASLSLARGGEEANFEKSALSNHNRRLLEENLGCVCIALYDPVCGKDGKTYSNSGCAACAGVEVKCLGRCPCKRPASGSCFCTMEYAPVCGSDGKTYSNRCHATCAHVPVACSGQCPCTRPQ